MLDEGLEGVERLSFALDGVGRPKDHDRPVVHRMVGARSREHEAIDDRRGDADRCPGLRRPDHPAADGAVPVEPVSHPPDRDRRDIGLAVEQPADVAHESGIEDRVDRRPLIAAAIRLLADTDTVARRLDRLGGGGSVGHRGTGFNASADPAGVEATLPGPASRQAIIRAAPPPVRRVRTDSDTCGPAARPPETLRHSCNVDRSGVGTCDLVAVLSEDASRWSFGAAE